MIQKSRLKGYTLSFTPQASKELNKLEISVAKKINKKLNELIEGASNLDITKMKGIEETYRLRCGNYRIIFEIKKYIVTVLVISIAHRKEVYRNY